MGVLGCRWTQSRWNVQPGTEFGKWFHDVHAADGALERRELDPLLLSSELRRLAREMRPLLGEAGWGMRLQDDGAYQGESYTAIFLRDVEEILGHLNSQI